MRKTMTTTITTTSYPRKRLVGNHILQYLVCLFEWKKAFQTRIMMTQSATMAVFSEWGSLGAAVTPWRDRERLGGMYGVP